MVVIPITDAGARIITVDTGGGVYRFRTYYSNGPEQRWLLDIRDTTETDIVTGVTIVPGSANILKGQGDAFKDVQLLAIADDGADLGGLDTPGNTLFLVWINAGEKNPFPDLDPMDTIDARYSV